MAKYKIRKHEQSQTRYDIRRGYKIWEFNWLDDDPEYFGIFTVFGNEGYDLTKELSHLKFPDTQRLLGKKMLIDLALATGMNIYRFVYVDVTLEDGVLVDKFGDENYVKPENMREELIRTANEVLRKYPELLQYSILPNTQVEELLKGDEDK